MALVSNSSPLIALARIGKLELLPKAFSEIVVPLAVREEVTIEVNRVGAREVAEAPWMRTLTVQDPKAVERLRQWLDPGESEAIILAREMDLPLAIDERRGRNLAASMGLETTGTVGMLLVFKKLQLVPKIAPLLDELVAQGIRLSGRLRDHALKMAHEPASSDTD